MILNNKNKKLSNLNLLFFIGFNFVGIILGMFNCKGVAEGEFAFIVNNSLIIFSVIITIVGFLTIFRSDTVNSTSLFIITGLSVGMSGFTIYATFYSLCV